MYLVSIKCIIEVDFCNWCQNFKQIEFELVINNKSQMLNILSNLRSYL